MSSPLPKFDDPPLICVVFTLTFTPVPKIGKYVRDFQDALRIQEFSGYHQHEGREVAFADGESDEPKITWRKVSRWDITSDDRATLIRVDERSLTIHFTEYRNFQNHRDQLRRILDLSEKTIPGLKMIGLTLRYINHIPLKQNEEPTDWVVPALLGLPSQADLGLKRRNSLIETVYETSENTLLVVRCSAFSSGLIIPPDILPLDLDIQSKADYPFLTFENLHQQSLSESFDSSKVFSKLDKLRSPIALIFAALTTTEAHQKWKIQMS